MSMSAAAFANGIVFVLVMHLIRADDVTSRPFAVIQAVEQGQSAFVQCGSDGQRETSRSDGRLYEKTGGDAVDHARFSGGKMCN